MHRFHLMLVACLGLSPLAGCEKNDQNRPPEAQSSADHANYAEGYPERVDSVSGDIAKGQTKLNESASQFASYPGAVKDPTDYDVVVEVYKAADESGRSQAYVERAQENETVNKILDENNGEVTKKVAGAVQYTAQQGGCQAELGNAAAGAMKRTFEKRMEERMKEVNRGYEVIERNEDKLGENNVATLQKHSDDIASASYVANIQLPTRRSELRRLVEERSNVERTIDRQIEEENKLQADAGTSDKAKKASQPRVKDLDDAKQKLAASQKYETQQLEQLDKDI
jgi:hypothetical protein